MLAKCGLDVAYTGWSTAPDSFLVAYRIDHSKVLISYELIAFNQEIKVG